MDIIENIYSLLPSLSTLVFFVIFYYAAKKILERQSRGKTDKALIRSIVLFLIALVGFITVILALPMSPDQKGNITSLIGIVLSAVLGLSSTTFIGNALAGIMLKLRKSFKPGDFISVNDIFGRVTEQGLFHTEVQTINRDLTTLPNMMLATNSVQVTRSSGTFINTEVSLGYDVSRIKIEKALKKAALDAGLSDPFVLITSLGDFSVVYKLHGLLQDVKSIISARSKLAASVMDALHHADIEIVSPTFMNQRQVGQSVFIPKKEKTPVVNSTEESPEDKIFDKAEQAESIEKRRELLLEVEKKIKVEQEKLKNAETAVDKEKIKKQLETTKQLKEKLETKIDKKVDEISSGE